MHTWRFSYHVTLDTNQTNVWLIWLLLILLATQTSSYLITVIHILTELIDMLAKNEVFPFLRVFRILGKFSATRLPHILLRNFLTFKANRTGDRDIKLQQIATMKPNTCAARQDTATCFEEKVIRKKPRLQPSFFQNDVFIRQTKQGEEKVDRAKW